MPIHTGHHEITENHIRHATVPGDLQRFPGGRRHNSLEAPDVATSRDQVCDPDFVVHDEHTLFPGHGSAAPWLASDAGSRRRPADVIVNPRKLESWPLSRTFSTASKRRICDRVSE